MMATENTNKDTVNTLKNIYSYLNSFTIQTKNITLINIPIVMYEIGIDYNVLQVKRR